MRYKALIAMISIMMLLAGAARLPAQEKNEAAGSQQISDPFRVTWIDLSFNNYYPIPGTRFADFSRMNFGGSFGVNFMVAGIRPLWLFINLTADYNLSSTSRMKWLVDAGVSAGLGWRVTLVKDRFFFTPRISYGYMLHASYGSYFNDQRIYLLSQNTLSKKYFLFSDQFLQYELEFAVDVTAGGRTGRCELFLSPVFIHFIEKYRQGLEAGYRLGVRFNVEGIETHRSEAAEKKKAPPTFIAGRVIDAETGAVLWGVAPALTGGKSAAGVAAAGETFAFSVEPGRDYVLSAEREGYEPGKQEVGRGALAPGARAGVIIVMKRSRVWGIFGHVFEKETNDPLRGVRAVVTEIGTNRVEEMETDGRGDFKMELRPNSDYDIVLKKRKYFTVRGSFSTRGRMPGWFDISKFMRTEFQKVIIGATVEFGNILYDSGRWDIRPDVLPSLEKIARFLADNPTIVVELGAHTDSMGDGAQNMTLSQKRAQSAVDYLLKRGVATGRITAQGYGETKLKNRCADGVACSALEHQENRRTEIKVLKITRE